MFSTPRSPLSIIFRPILYFLGLATKPQLNMDVELSLPPDDGTSLPVEFWSGSTVKSYLAFPGCRDYKVVLIRRYKKDSPFQHEYMVATVEHPQKARVELQIERGRDNVQPNGAPVLTKEQEAVPPPSSGGDISTGQWAYWTEEVKGQQPVNPEPPRKLSGEMAAMISTSSESLSKVGHAYDIVRIWKPLKKDTLIESLDLRPDPMPLAELAILANTVHQKESLYNLFKSQCFWYADMIARVIAKKRNIIPAPTADEEFCYHTNSGKFHKIPVHVARPKVVQALEKEFDERCRVFREQVREQLEIEDNTRQDKDRLAKADLVEEQLRKDLRRVEAEQMETAEKMQTALRRVRELELAQMGQGSTQPASSY
ncbi:hypothetical protein GALMADRAFT_135734 [Galerina marginata CBS 339.88]|uniref:Uncharacterized protein n=1 Tax=Galerina marginata (strain CBS 339.88) TaxID=685588 RepID=A0A067TBL3_GALM3|nr:hypothetical protein GALMADRAFT_135734 [Galerina marginata CBS 339.88]